MGNRPWHTDLGRFPSIAAQAAGTAAARRARARTASVPTTISAPTLARIITAMAKLVCPPDASLLLTL
ncbi:hypothetical protein ACQPW1_32385 [Nocardia sp. CA-128927]|uniref:hypothetical protein n=1 Tax=Nocardia sp. CA-128927 TaxID=3239975 RepID=UPI003D995F7E